MSGDFRLALRALLRRPGFTLVVLLTLALGIGANAVIFSLVDGVLLRPLPYADAGRLAAVWGVYPGTGRTSTSLPDFRDWRAQTRAFDQLAAAHVVGYNMGGASGAERVTALRATANYLPTLGVAPALGRGFLPEEERGGARVVVLGWDFWQHRHAGDPAIVGRTITLNGSPYTVVGIAPRALAYPERTDIVVPLDVADTNAARRSEFLDVVGRLAPGATLERAGAEMRTISERLAQAYPATNQTIRSEVVSLHEQVVGDVRPALLVFMGAVGIVLLVVCVNVANLLLARAVGREREIAIRAALGATRGRILRQLALESLLLALGGGLLGLGLASTALRLLRAAELPALPRLADVTLDPRVVLFALALSVATGALFGIVPALRLAATSLQGTLREGGRGASGGAGTLRLRGMLVLAEVALAVVLLVGAGLLLRSFVALQREQPGFDPERVMTARVALPAARYREDPKVRAFWGTLVARAAALPGVRAAGATSSVPIGGGEYWSIGIAGRPQTRDPNAPPQDVQPYSVTPGYFGAMRIPLVRGRLLADGDVDGAPLVAVVNAEAARRYFGQADPIGERVTFGDTARYMTIVGVVGNVTGERVGAEPYPQLYAPLEQLPRRGMYLAVRTTGEPARVTAALRGLVTELDAELPLYDVHTMEERLAESIARPRLTAALTGAFALAALVLAALGVYGVVAYAVAQRTRELGVRMALGASAAAVVRLVVRQAMTPVALGVAVGLAGAWAGGRVLRRLLYGVGATDPATFAATALFLVAIAATAAWLPARRATRIDPTEALRHE